MRKLEGVVVLVTRPEQQATPLCRLFEAHGATAINLPVIAIEPVADREALMAAVNPHDPFDLIIFTSINAVKFGAPLLDRSRALTLAAIGPATSRALDEAGLGTAVRPTAGFDSESLLLHPALAHLAARRVLIIKGVHGRKLLQEQLRKRGAGVVVAEVYERKRTHHRIEDLAALEAMLAASAIVIVTATSVEIADNVFELATPAMRRAFDRVVHWLVPSARVAAALRARDVVGPIIHAHSAQDHHLVAAALRWRSSESGA